MGRAGRRRRGAEAGAALTLEELRAFAGERLAAYKLPKRLEFVAALPRNATGKILKFKLRQTLAKPAEV